MTSMQENEVAFFRKNGYLLIPGILDAAEVLELRRRALEIFRSGEWKRSVFNTDRVLSDVYNTFPEFIHITLKTRVLDKVRMLLGDNPVLMPETAIHHKFYTGWHKDTTSQERSGHHFHKKEQALMIEAGFYLQDNDQYGGGLTVMPGSHLTQDPFLTPQPVPTILQRIKRRLLPYREAEDRILNPSGHEITDIPSKAGDMVIFDFRLNHRATRPANGKVSDVPPEKEKLAFFNAFSVNNETATDYLNYIYSRDEPFYRHIRSVPRCKELLEHGKNNSFTVF